MTAIRMSHPQQGRMREECGKAAAAKDGEAEIGKATRDSEGR
jgi:hypothetical protein